ncbi:MAG: hypothetical protein FJ112_02795 [Deltaproteobacteria bacterium]|nr:hypothetical protein [Deltaproteobacteria bacterium]
MEKIRLFVLVVVLFSWVGLGDVSPKCEILLKKIPVRFNQGQRKVEFTVETPTAIQKALQDAVARVQKKNINDPQQYREALQKEIARVRAEQEAKQSVQEDVETGKLKFDQEDRQKQIDNLVLRRTFDKLKDFQRESVLFVDTPVLGNDGKSLNSVIPLVVDHHGAYAPQNGLNNSGAQIIELLVQARERNKNPDGSVNINKAQKDFSQTLFGSDPSKVILSSDNLADGAEVIALLRNPELQKRIINDPDLAKTLTEAGRFTDFFVFSGEGYEKTNVGASSQEAIQLSKAIMQSHSELLKEYGIPFGDRIVALKDPKKEKALLEEAIKRSEELLLAFTEPKAAQREPAMERVRKLAAGFNSAREASVVEAGKMHRKFSEEIKGDLDNKPSLIEALNQFTYGHKPVATGNQFADWGASPIANARDKSKPIKFELAGDNPNDNGKPVILAKSGSRTVNLQPLADALNSLVRVKKETELKSQGKSDQEISSSLANLTPQFTARGTDLVFSFGGHSLTRREITQVVAETIRAKGTTLVP